MRTWQRAVIETRCGLCAKPIPLGDAMLVFTIATVKKPIQRCQACAGYPAPEDLPSLVDRAPVPMSAPPLTGTRAHAAMGPKDWKARSAGEREPGEDG